MNKSKTELFCPKIRKTLKEFRNLSKKEHKNSKTNSEQYEGALSQYVVDDKKRNKLGLNWAKLSSSWN